MHPRASTTNLITAGAMFGQERGSDLGEVKAVRAVAGSLSWVPRQCRPDEAGTASTLQGSASRAVVKDL